MRRILSAVVLAALLGGTVPAAAQSADRWQLTLESGEIVWDVRLKGLAGERLEVTQHDSLVSVPVGEIREMRRIRKSEMSLGDGTTAGAMAALTGADDEVFDFAPLDFGGRLRAVQQILLQHPPGTARP